MSKRNWKFYYTVAATAANGYSTAMYGISRERVKKLIRNAVKVEKQHKAVTFTLRQKSVKEIPYKVYQGHFPIEITVGITYP